MIHEERLEDYLKRKCGRSTLDQILDALIRIERLLGDAKPKIPTLGSEIFPVFGSIRRGCRIEGWCRTCKVVVRDQTCFCAGICPLCDGWCPETDMVPNEADSVISVIYLNPGGRNHAAFYERGRFIKKYEVK